MQARNASLLAVVPAYNETGALAEVVSSLHDLAQRLALLEERERHAAGGPA